MAVSAFPSLADKSSQPGRALALAAIDLDGTLLGPDLRISPENLRGWIQGLGFQSVENPESEIKNPESRIKNQGVRISGGDDMLSLLRL